MAELVLISHGPLCEGLKESAEMILGPGQPIHTLPLSPEMGAEDYQEKLKALLDSVKEPVVLCDLAGGTPCNSAMKLLFSGMDFPLYTGMNLPMVIGAMNDMWTGQPVNPVAPAVEGIQKIDAALLLADDDEDE